MLTAKKRELIYTVILAFLFLFACELANATTWAYVPLSQLVNDSDTIVIGRLVNAGEQHPIINRMFDQVDKVARTSHKVTFEGTIIVDKALLGNVKPGDKLDLQWTWPTYFTPNSAKGGIWLLIKKGSHFEANYPWRVRSISDQPEVLRLINEPVTLIADDNQQEFGNNINAKLRIRNHGNKPMTIPHLDLSRADITTSGTKPVNVILNFHKARTSTEALKIAAQEEIYLPVDLNKLMKITPWTTYQIQTVVDGLPISSSLELSIYSRR